MVGNRPQMLVASILLLLCSSYTHAGCPHAARMLRAAGDEGAVPEEHPALAASAASAMPPLQEPKPPVVSATYIAAFKRLTKTLEGVVADCQFSIQGMDYANNTKIIVNSDGVFFPAATWLRAFFHDAGTFIVPISKGGPKGGPNGSLGVGCPQDPCGTLTAVNNLNGVPVTNVTVCPNGAPSVSGFSDGQSYCCPNANECIAHGQSPNNESSPGLTVPVCLIGSADTVELCRRENDNLHPTIQAFRKQQHAPDHTYRDPAGGPNKTISLADFMVAAAIIAVKQCSRGRVVIPHTVGRKDATIADDTLLPSTEDVVEHKHIQIFANMGLNKNAMVTMVTGSHSIGGFRNLNSPSLTDCPYVPFDCTTAGQTSAVPFDNNVFKVACDGIRGITKGASCDWNDKCTDPIKNETDQGCPFDGRARDAYQRCSGMPGYPKPGIITDRIFCQDLETRGRMVKFAQDQGFFYEQYASLFLKLAKLGYRNVDIRTVPGSG